MKKIFLLPLLLFSLSFFSGCDNDILNTVKDITSTEPVEVYKKGNVYCKIGSNKPFTGKGKKTVYKSKSFTLYEIKNGVLNGPFVDFDSKGRVVKEGYYKNNQYHGTVKSYDYDPWGILGFKEVQYDDNGLYIREKAYGMNGTLITDLYWDSKGKKNGWMITRYNYEDYKVYKRIYKDGVEISKTPYKGKYQ